MDLVPLHPKLIHLPIALSVLMPFIAGGISAAIRRELLPPRSWVMVVVLQTLLLLSGFAAASSGENDEHLVAELVPHEAIEAHETAANQFLAGSAAVLALSIAALATRAAEQKRLFLAATVIGTVFVMLLAQRVGDAGGELVYVHGAARAYTGELPPPLKSPP